MHQNKNAMTVSGILFINMAHVYFYNDQMVGKCLPAILNFIGRMLHFIMMHTHGPDG
jgi:hypothetical protein